MGLGLDDNQYDMVAVSVLTTPTFYIDRTEVTMREYADWALSEPSLEGQDGRCVWNQSYKPTERAFQLMGEGCDSMVWLDWLNDATDHPDYPANCMDWCDALAYCRAQGKRLCGGTNGEAITRAYDGLIGMDFNDPQRSEWFAACTAGDIDRRFPYGPNAQLDTCVDSLVLDGECTTGRQDRANVGTPACEGGIPGLHDMSGNVWEWVDACYADAAEVANHECVNVGGSYLACTEPELSCYHDGMRIAVRFQQDRTTGFRCCTTP